MPEARSVSVVVPAHGRAEFLAEALAGVLAQSHGALTEVLVVDDTAAPATREVVERAGREARVPVRYLARGGAPGASASRNHGARAATGELLAFLDDDDLWLPDHLAGLVAAMADGARFAISWMLVQDGTGRTAHYAMRRGVPAAGALAVNPGMTGSNLLVERDLFLAVGGFDPDLPVSNDKDLLVRLLDAAPVYGVSEARTAVHRRHGLGQLTTWDESRATALFAYLRKYDARLTRSQRRYLMRQVYSIRRRSGGALRRARYTVLFAAYASPRHVLGRLRARAA